ncbi:hypothetical protein HXX76_015529 [Chlamydomonas incerta]|uniref:Uncharacterized protein n=1 Tax=Chlamydomonas incerta TaxID=51695 RepID=A0A835SA60_CHLIN|nr:hypothetical protein HXX76_015529 [Chlamydomonas incerta]|eukprot:KAG2423144.1 hypothetical protein HXX76_015529 [Chlamydomonas incerta]
MRRASEPEVSRPGRVKFGENRVVEAPGTARRDPAKEDANVLLKDFDNRFRSIQDLLQRYQAQKTAQARGTSLPPEEAARGGGGAAAAGGGGGGGGGDADGGRTAALAAASSRRKMGAQSQSQGQGQRVSSSGAGGVAAGPAPTLDEESRIRAEMLKPRRVKSAAPGASRALSAKIDFYRANPELAQRKAEKARTEQLDEQRAAAAAAAEANSGAPPPVNFIASNRRSIMPYSLPYGLQMTIESLRDHGIRTLHVRDNPGTALAGPTFGIGDRMPINGPGASRRPASAMPAFGRSTGRAGAGSRVGSAGPAASVAAAGGGGGRPDSGVHAAWTAAHQHQHHAQTHAHERPFPDPTVAHDDGHHAHESHTSTLFLTAVDVPGPSHPSSDAPGGPGRGSASGTAPHSPPAGSYHQAPPHSPPTGAHPGLSLNLPQSPYRPGSGMPHSPYGPYSPRTGGGHAGGAQPGSPAGPHQAWAAAGLHGGPPEGSVVGSSMAGYGVDSRRLRLVLSSRPASGGSPTRRREFIAEHAAIRAERAAHAADVRERAWALEEHRRRTIAMAAEVRAQQRREEEARQAEAKAAAELQERQRGWTAIVGLCSKLAFIAEQVQEDRRVRSLRALRKAAAVKIATWYKGILLRRRHRELVELVQRLRRLVLPYVATQKVALRQRCALRLVEFMQYAESSNMAVVGVRRLKHGVELLQTSWRNALLVRNLQRSALYNQLTRVEREIVTANKRNERNMQLQMMRLGKSVNIMDPDSALVPAGYGSMHSRAGAGAASVGQSMRSMTLGGDSMRSGATGAAGFGGGWGDWQSNAGASQKSMAAGLPGSPSGLERGGSRSYDRSRLPGRGALHDPGDDEDEALARHTEMVGREAREAVAERFLLAARREHRKLLEKYSADKAVYLARRPIEEMRQKMLRDAGLHVEPEVRPPVMPRMRLVYPRAVLRDLLKEAVQVHGERMARLAEEEEAQRLVEEAEAAEAAQFGHGGGHHGGGVTWGDNAYHGGRGRNLAGIHGSVTRGGMSRRSPSRKMVSHKSLRHG